MWRRAVHPQERRETKPAPSCRRNFAVLCAALGRKGNGHEETFCCRADFAGIRFDRGKSTGACRKRGPRRGVGRHRAGTDRRGGGCVHRIYRGTVDCAFLGTSAARIATTCATCGKIRPCAPAAGCCRGKFAGTRQDVVTSRQEGRAATGSGIRVETPVARWQRQKI